MTIDVFIKAEMVIKLIKNYSGMCLQFPYFAELNQIEYPFKV